MIFSLKIETAAHFLPQAVTCRRCGRRFQAEIKKGDRAVGLTPTGRYTPPEIVALADTVERSGRLSSSTTPASRTAPGSNTEVRVKIAAGDRRKK
jgi:hypothetical protein